MTATVFNEMGQVTFIGLRSPEDDRSQDALTIEVLVYAGTHGGGSLVLHFPLERFVAQTGITLPETVFAPLLDEGWSFDGE